MKTRRECPQGHVYFKSSDCPTCPRCEAARDREVEFLAQLAAPARRALAGAGLNTLDRLARKYEDDVQVLHGMGPNAMNKLRASLKKAGLNFKRRPA